MPEEAQDPVDVTGLPYVPPSSGKSQGTANVARALGLPADTVPEDDSDEDEQKDDNTESSNAQSQKADPDQKKRQLAENADAVLQRNMEDAYAIALHRARSEDGYLDKLTQSSDPIEQRLAAKIIARNDFGAKTVEEYRKTSRMKAAKGDPAEERLIRLESELEELRSGTKTQDWSNWKKDNAVTGEAAELADQVHAEYSTMSYSDVLSLVRGKMGIASKPLQKESMGFVRGGSGMPEEDQADFESPLAKALLPNIKATKKFAKQYLKGARR